jgi:hypothetical protein
VTEHIDSGPSEEFPDRPDHPHFRLLANLAQDLDGDTGARAPGPEAFFEAEKLDEASVSYMAAQRTNRAIMAAIQLGISSPEVIIQAAVIDGFALGYLMALNRPDLP